MFSDIRQLLPDPGYTLFIRASMLDETLVNISFHLHAPTGADPSKNKFPIPMALQGELTKLDDALDFTAIYQEMLAEMKKQGLKPQVASSPTSAPATPPPAASTQASAAPVPAGAAKPAPVKRTRTPKPAASPATTTPAGDGAPALPLAAPTSNLKAMMLAATPPPAAVDEQQVLLGSESAPPAEEAPPAEPETPPTPPEPPVTPPPQVPAGAPPPPKPRETPAEKAARIAKLKAQLAALETGGDE